MNPNQVQKAHDYATAAKAEAVRKKRAARDLSARRTGWAKSLEIRYRQDKTAGDVKAALWG